MKALVIALLIFAAYVIYVVLTSDKSKLKPKTLADYGGHVNRSAACATTQIDPHTQYFAWPKLMDYDFKVVVESYYQDSLRRIAEQQENNPSAGIKPLTAHLIPCEANQHDDKVVRIDINGVQVGHLSHQDAKSFRRRLGAKKLTGQITTCGAIITGRQTKDGKILSYGIVLDIKPFG